MDFLTIALALSTVGFAAIAMLAYARAERLRAGVHPLQQQLAALQAEAEGLRAANSRYDREKAVAEARLAEQETTIKKVQGEFQLKFENLANRIFEEKNSQSKKNLDEVLGPLKEDLTGFKKYVGEAFGEQAKQQFSLKNEIERMFKATSEMTVQTDGLSKALRGDVRVQGRWGEVTLERILEASGLRRGEEYRAQGAGMNLKHVEDGSALKPDYIICLPENKHVVVDSKVSLTAYERFFAAQEEAERAQHLAQFIASIKNHVKGLEERRYQDTENLGTPDFVLMFMPIEGAYALAMQEDRELHHYAWERKIVIVCPSTLFATLRTIASVWKLERQNKNALDIAKQGASLYAKVVGFVEDMEALGKQLSKAQGTYDEALNKLSRGRGNIISHTEKLRELGVKHSKTISERLTETDEQELLTLVDQEEVA